MHCEVLPYAVSEILSVALSVTLAFISRLHDKLITAVNSTKCVLCYNQISGAIPALSTFVSINLEITICLFCAYLIVEIALLW